MPHSRRSFRAGLFIGCRGLILVWMALWLAGCTGTTLRAPFRGYSRAYADAMNEQLLLNLARLDNGHPAYHLAIGAINNKMTMSAEATGGGTRNETDSATSTATSAVTPTGLLGVTAQTLQQVASTVTGGTVGTRVSGTASPDFQLIPLNNEAVSAQLLKPISTEVFFTLYQQGYPVDQLLRVLIERIEATLPNREELTLFNSPVRGSKDSYITFLRTCAVLRELQRTGDLQLVTSSEPEIIASFTAVARDAKGAAEDDGPQADIFPLELPEPDGNRRSRGGSGSGSGWTPGSTTPPPASDVFEADAKGWRYRKAPDGVWQLTRERKTPYFTLRPGGRKGLATKMQAAGIGDPHEVVGNLVQMLNDGIWVKTSVEGRTKPGTSRLILRSYTRILEAVADEQNGFAVLARDPVFRAEVPAVEQRPILRTVWAGSGGHLQPVLQRLDYAGKTYQITDPKLSPLDPAATWNRDVFRLLASLASQVTVDISKYQRQVLELR